MRTKDCIICTDKIKKKNLVTLPCCHIFHTTCVIKLVRKRTKIRWNVKQLERHKNLS